jgi:mono/diheme cytochrome c family protein
MTMVLALLAAAGVAGGLSGCATGKASLPTANALGAAGALPRGTDIDALRRGRAILVTECANCHRLFLPAEYSPEQWGGIVKRMANRASLGEDQAADLYLYLSTASRTGK